MIDLNDTHIKYDDTITEDVFNRIVSVASSVGYTPKKWCHIDFCYENFRDRNDANGGYLRFINQVAFIDNCKNSRTEIKVSDILGEGWDKKSLTQTLIEDEQESIRRNLKLYLDMNPTIELKDEFWYKKLKKGDFVVSLTDYFPDSTRRKDYVFFIEEDFVKPHRQNLADRIHYIGMSSGSCSAYSVEEFRPATQQEKELYLAFGKPVHINTPLPKDNASTCPKQASNNYAGRVVHVETKEQWDFVSLKLGYNWFADTWDYYGSASCIDLTSNTKCSLTFYKENNYEVVSFGDWLDETNNGVYWIEFLNHKAATDVIDINMSSRWDDMCTGYSLSYLSDKYIVGVDPCGTPTPTKKQPVLLKDKKIEIKLPVKKKVTLNMNIKH